MNKRPQILIITLILFCSGILFYLLQTRPSKERDISVPIVQKHFPSSTPETKETPEITMTPIAPLQEPEEELDPEFYKITGIVFDKETKLPLEKASVNLTDEIYNFFGDENLSWLEMIKGSTETGSDGRFSMKAPFFERFSLIVSKHGYEYKIVTEMNSDIRGNLLRIYLGKGSLLKGCTIDSKTKLPISNAHVFYPQMISEAGSQTTVFPFIAETDRNGKFSFDQIPEGIYEVGVKASGYEPILARIMTGVEETIILKSGGVNFLGKVLTQITQKPAIEKDLLFQSDMWIPFRVKTDAEGNFTVTGIKPGRAFWKIKWSEPDQPLWCGYLVIPNNPKGENIIYCPEPVQVKGRVVNSRNNQPVTDGCIVFGYPRASTSTAMIERDGSFKSNEFLVKNHVYFTIRIPGYVYLNPQFSSYNFHINSDSIPFNSKDDLERLQDLIISVEPAIKIMGQVVDASNNKPVGNALVNFSSYPGFPSKDSLHCDKEGKFTLEFPDALPQKDVYISHGEYGSTIRTIRIPSDVTTQTVLLKLDPPEEIRGNLLSTEGEAMTNGRISAFLIPVKTNQYLRFLVQSSEALEDGSFTFFPVQPGKYALSINAEGFQPEEILTEIPWEPLKIILKPSGILKGRVFDDTGAPVIRKKVGSYSGYHTGDGSASVTDHEGRFILKNIPEQGRINLRIYITPWHIHEDFVNMPQEEEVLITVKRQGGIKGKLVDKETGETVINFTSALYRKLQDRQDLFRSLPEFTPEGEFYLNDVVNGNFSLELKADKKYAFIEDISVKSGEITDLGEIPLEKAISQARIKTFDSNSNEPIENCRLILRIKKGGQVLYGWNDSQGITDENGSWIAGNLVPSVYQLTVDHKDYLKISREIELNDGDDMEFEIALSQGCKVEGIVLDDETNNPIQNAGVKLSSQNELIYTDAKGKFSLEGIDCKAESYVEVSATGKASVRRIFTPENVSEPLIVRMEAGHYISGNIEDKDGKPLSDVKVSASSPEGVGGILDSTDQDGRFKLEGLSYPPVWIYANKHGYETARIKIDELDKDDVKLIMDTLPTISFKVVYEDGRPVTEPFSVYQIQNGRKYYQDTQQNARGEFNILNLYEGEHTCEVRVGDALGGIKTFLVAAGAEPRTEIIVVKPLTYFNGTVINESGERITNATVFVLFGKIYSSQFNWMDKQNLMNTNTDDNGAFSFQLSQGEYTLFVDHPEYVAASLETVVSEHNEDAIVTLKSGGILEVMVFYNSNEEPIRNVKIQASKMGISLNIFGVTNDEGYYKFQNLLPGEYSIILTPMENTTITKRITISRDEPSSLFIGIPEIIHISLRLLYGDSPVKGEYINIIGKSNEGYHFHGVTNSEGRIECNLFPGDFNIRMNALNINRSITISEEDEGKEFTINLSVGSITVTLLDSQTDKPIPSVSIELRPHDYRGGNQYGKTDSHGEALFKNVLHNTYTIHVSPSEEYRSYQIEEIIFSKEEQEKSITIHLEKGISLLINLFDEESGEPVNEDFVTFSLRDKHTGQDVRSHITYPSKGKAKMSGIAPGSYILTAGTLHYKAEEQEIVIKGDSEIRKEIPARKMAAFRIRAKEPLTGSFPSLQIEIRMSPANAMNRTAYHRWMNNGTECGPLKAGEYYYRLKVNGYEDMEGIVTLEKGETKTIELELKSKE